MYHDQGLIPIKMYDFKEAINFTLGLPFIRTSVGHGTAYDIAGRGLADPTNLIKALLMAAKLSNSRKIINFEISEKAIDKKSDLG
jgi:4-hydroxythreonine-4-phosphate dehydrogenase